MGELASDPRFSTNIDRVQHKETLIPLLENAVQKWDAGELLQRLGELDVPAAPILSIDKALNDPQVLDRNMVVEMNYPNFGKYKTVGNPIKTTAMEDGNFKPAPILGEHTEEILSRYLGMSPQEIERLKQEEII